MTRAGSRWRATIVTALDGREGRRTLEARACPRLTEAVALVLAMALDESAEDAPTVIAPATARNETPLFIEDGELPPVLRRRRAAPVRTPDEGWRVGLSARGGFDVGTLPGLSPTFALGLRLDRGVFEARVEFGLLAARDAAGSRPGSFARFEGWTVDALACLRAGRRVEAGACAGVEALALTATATGFAQNRDDTSLTWGAELRVWAGVSLGRALTVAVEPGLMVPLTRFRYEVAGVGSLHAVAPVVLRGALTATVRWP